MPETTPLWLDRPTRTHPPLEGDATYDVAVVGAGLTGLLTALLVARGGLSVVVLEGREVGVGTTGHSTGKVSLLQGTKLVRAIRRNPPSVVRDYVEANREGQAWLRRFCEEHEVPFQVRPSMTYATTRVGELKVRAEHAAAREAGLDVSWTDDPGLPFPTRGAARLDGQLQLHPMDLLGALVAGLRAEGGVIHGRTRVTRVDRDHGRVRLRTGRGTVLASSAVLATSMPILDRGGWFARLVPQRSYAATLRSEWTAPGMYLSADQPVRSIRSVPIGGEELLLVGGNGHVTGRDSSPSTRAGDLVAWARRELGAGEVTHRWSAQDQSPVSGLPYVGPVLPGNDRLLVATGYDKWGFAVAPAAALLLSKRLFADDEPRWGRALRSWSAWELAGLPDGMVANGAVGLQMAQGWLRRAVGADRPPVCTHLGGVLRWNDAECSWDCPLHGSRFDADGSVLEGPATQPLAIR